MGKYEDFPKFRILVFGDSNTYGYDCITDGRFSDRDRFSRILENDLGRGHYTVIEEGLPGRTSVFDDPLSEGLCGITAIYPCMMSHAPLDLVILMLGTNDTKERFRCNAYQIGKGLVRLAEKASLTPAWRSKPNVLLVNPAVISPDYSHLKFYGEMGNGCSEKAGELGKVLKEMLCSESTPGIRDVKLLDANEFPDVCVSKLDGMHLTKQAHAALAHSLSQYLKKETGCQKQ